MARILAPQSGASAQVVCATGRDVRLVPISPVSSTSSYKDFGPLVIDRFAETLGPGYAFKRVTLEMTSDPVTKGIEGKLPKWQVKSYDDVRKSDGSTLTLEERQWLINVDRGLKRSQ